MPQATDFDPPSDFSEAAERLRGRGIVLRKHPGFYSVNSRNGSAATEYQAEDLTDVFMHGMTMEVAPSPPPLGPVGKGMTRRALMYRHNRKLAAKRARAVAGTTYPATGRTKIRPKRILLDLTDEIDAATKPWTCPQCRAVYKAPYTVYIGQRDQTERCFKCANV